MIRAFVFSGAVIAAFARQATADAILDRAYTLPDATLALGVTTGEAKLPLPGIDPIATVPASFVAALGLSRVTLGAGYEVIAHDDGGTYPRDGRWKGTLDVHAIVGVLARGRWTVAAGGELAIDLAAERQTLRAGIAARYRLAARVALFAGEPFGPEPVARQIAITRPDPDGVDVDVMLPVGAAVAATPCLVAYAAVDPLGPGVAGGVRARLGRRFDLVLRGGLADVRDRDVWAVSAGLIWYATPLP